MKYAVKALLLLVPWISHGNPCHPLQEPVILSPHELYFCQGLTTNDSQAEISPVCILTGYASKDQQTHFGDQLIVSVTTDKLSPLHRFAQVFHQNMGLFWSPYRSRALSSEKQILARTGQNPSALSFFEYYYEWNLQKENHLLHFQSWSKNKNEETLIDVEFSCEKVMPL